MKKAISIFLSICLLISACVLPAFATEDKTEYKIVSGVVSFDEEPQRCWFPSNSCVRFAISDGTTTEYLCVNEKSYSYFVDAFNGKSLTLKCQLTDSQGRRNGDTINKYGDTVRIDYPMVVSIINGENQMEIDDYLFFRYKGTEEQPNFSAYKDFLLRKYSYWYSYEIFVPEDGSYLEIANNGKFVESFSSAIAETVLALGLPTWLGSEICNTKAVDGRQKEVFDYMTVTWTYDAENGYDVIFRLN